MPGGRPARSKTLATWLAVLGGSLGLLLAALFGALTALPDACTSAKSASGSGFTNVTAPPITTSG